MTRFFMPPAPYSFHPTPHTLHFTPFTLHPMPCTLHTTPYTLHPTLYTLHPTPYTPHPTEQWLPSLRSDRLAEFRLESISRDNIGARIDQMDRFREGTSPCSVHDLSSFAEEGLFTFGFHSTTTTRYQKLLLTVPFASRPHRDKGRDLNVSEQKWNLS